MPIALLLATHLLVASAAFLVGTRLRAASTARRIKEANDYAEGCLRASVRAEHHGYQRGDRDGFNRGVAAATLTGEAIDELFGYDQ